MKSLLVFIGKTLYSILCLAITALILFWGFYIYILSNIGLDSFLYVIFLISIILAIWSLLFIKIKFTKKLVIFVGCFLFFVGSLFTPIVKKAIKVDICVDTGICPEGIKMKNDQGVLFEINQENCIKYGYKWNEKRNACNLREKP